MWMLHGVVVKAKPQSPWVLWVAMLVLFLTPLRAAAQSWKWTQETIDTWAQSTSIAVDREGNVHVSYASDNGSVLKYAFRSAVSNQWFTMVLDKQLQDFATDLALDPQGKPRICYTPRELKYAQWDGKRWSIQQISPGGSVEYNCTTTISSDGTPHVIWYHTRSKDGSIYLHLKYATLKEGAWLARTVDFNGEDGKWNSMVLDAHGIPHVIYSVFPGGELKYAYLDGNDWKVRLGAKATGMNSAGMGNSLALDANDDPLFSFYEAPVGYDAGSGSSLKFAQWKGTGWDIQTVAPVFPRGSWVGFRSSLVLDTHGFPHISYEDSGALKHAFWDGTKWQAQTVAPRSLEPYLFSSMAIGQNDTLYISYKDPTDGSLKVAIGRTSSEGTSTEVQKQRYKKN
jgi:hypothetical protein